MAKKVEQIDKERAVDTDVIQQIPVEITDEKNIDTKLIPPHIDRILKNNSRHESLYIDSHEGCFTPDTPENIRGNAVHYKNPYHIK